MLNSSGTRYLLVGGHAVGYYGYPRATGDMDVWIPTDKKNAHAIMGALRQFGMPANQTVESLIMQPGQIIRMGYPPVRIELLTSISGVEFDECFANREMAEIDGIPVNIISLPMLKKNKRASGRLKHLEDLRHLA
ncbi:MAG: hypothetical protein JW941_01760 [Candidatus Coatesbacteria bacterium]|nr:hypothetical protein [Candidatus Coatesbacteria bacterium]